MPIQILVVDDEPNLQSLIRQIFRKETRQEEYTLLFALNGAQALEMLQTNPTIDIALTDINMPTMDGLTLLTKLSEIKPSLNPVLTAVIFSAYDDMKNIRKAMNEGAFDFLTKPLDPADLRVTVQKTAQHVQRLKSAIQQEKQAREALRRINEELEMRVKRRTAELTAANVALKAGNAELDAFARTVAHDLKNPLGIISSYSSILLEAGAGNELSPQELEIIFLELNKISQKAVNIIDELLLLAGVRRWQADLQRLEMGAIVARVQKRFELMINEYQGKIVLPRRWPVAVGHVPWVEEMWANYLSNGLKYGGKPPHLEFGATPLSNGMVRFWISDNGPGLTPEQQGSLFTEFTRLDTVRVEGHGLGLSIVRRIVEKLGGQAGVESAVGEGSTFYFTLPGAGKE